MRDNDSVPPTPIPTSHAKATPTAKAAPKWETACKERIKTAIRQFQKPLTDLVARDANETDTRFFVTDFLTDALGYDKWNLELASEYRVKGDFADYGLRIDKQLVAFLECKRATTRLGIKHLHQVQMYALNEGVEWVILTNGPRWEVYHITAGLPVTVDLAFAVDLLGTEPAAKKADLMFFISREALKKRLIDDLWRATAATSPKSLAAALLSDRVLKELRMEVKRRSDGHNVDEKDLARLLRDTVIRSEAL